MSLDDTVGDREAEARAAPDLLRRVERFEDLLDLVRWDARTGVAYLDRYGRRLVYQIA